MSVVSELREMADDRAAKFSIGHYWNICDQAADELERLERKADDAVMLIHKLQAENEQLRAAVSNCTGELGCEAYKLAGTADETSPSTREPPVDPDSDVSPVKSNAHR